MRNPERIV
jgi:hypothetical protein